MKNIWNLPNSNIIAPINGALLMNLAAWLSYIYPIVYNSDMLSMLSLLYPIPPLVE